MGGRGAASPAGSQPDRPGAEPADAGEEPADPILAAARRVAFLPVVRGNLGTSRTRGSTPPQSESTFMHIPPTALRITVHKAV